GRGAPAAEDVAEAARDPAPARGAACRTGALVPIRTTPVDIPRVHIPSSAVRKYCRTPPAWPTMERRGERSTRRPPQGWCPTTVIAERARLVNATYLLSDLGATAAALGVAYLGRTLVSKGTLPFVSALLPPFEWYLPLLALILVIWPLVFYALGLYGRRGRSLHTETSGLVTGVGVAGLVLTAVIFGAKLTYISRPVVLVFLLLDVLFVAGGRRLVRGLLLGGDSRRALLVAGGRDEVERAAAAIDAHRDWG